MTPGPRWAVAALALVAAGCAFGPKAIEQTHGRYAQALTVKNPDDLCQ